MRTSFTILILAVLSSGGATWGQQVDWLKGTQLNRQARETAISLDWQSAPLRQRLSELTSKQRISVFLDRRIDGSQEIKFSAVNVSFEELLWRLCEQIDAGMCRLDDVYYVGPKATVATLPAELLRIKQTVSASKNKRQQRRWQRVSAVTLAPLTEPKVTLEGYCRGVDCGVTNLDEIPHDLWGETQLGNSSLTGRIALMLAGFDKSFQLSEDLESLQIIDRLPSDTVEREFLVGEKVGSTKTVLSKEFPHVAIGTKKRSLVVTGSVEDVLAVHRKLVSLQKPRVAALSDQTFDVKMAETRLNILKAISSQISRQLKYEPDHLEQLNARVEIEMKQATINRLIERSLQGSGLKYRLTDEALEIINEN